ncbi:hypothetical protein ACTPEF_23975 [Clostridioides difficile]
MEIAYKINALGVRNLAIASEKVNAKLFLYQTSYQHFQILDAM